MRAQQPSSVVSTLAPLKLSNVDSVPTFSNAGLIDYKQGFSVPTKLESTPETPPAGPYTALALVRRTVGPLTVDLGGTRRKTFLTANGCVALQRARQV